jgi:hypothetical protein
VLRLPVFISVDSDPVLMLTEIELMPTTVLSVQILVRISATMGGKYRTAK